jgi:hypothetical protein
MKRSIVFTALILICFGIKAIAAGPDICYVKTADKVYFGNDVKKGMVYTKIISSDGTITKVANNEIKSYMHEGKRFDLLPLTCPDTRDTLCFAFMEYLTSKSGLKLYRYECCELRDHVMVYFVYKDDKLYLGVNHNNAESVLPFFGIKNVRVI